MNVLLTGSSGFLGRAIQNVLTDYKIITLSRSNADITTDLAKEVPVLPQCDLVIHVAGKAHFVPRNEMENQQFYNVNVTGTANLLKALERATLPKSFIFISSVSVYGLDKGNLITENNQLLAIDPYGKSKIETEKLIWNWCEENQVICTILRLPLVMGANPTGNLKTMINGIKKGYYFNIAGGKAKKSMVLAEDVANIIPIAANIGGIYNLTDGYHPSFIELSNLIAQQLGKSQPLNISVWLAQLMAKAGDLIGSKAPINSHKLLKITSDLTFDDSSARQLLGWKPASVLSGFKID